MLKIKDRVGTLARVTRKNLSEDMWHLSWTQTMRSQMRDEPGDVGGSLVYLRAVRRLVWLECREEINKNVYLAGLLRII